MGNLTCIIQPSAQQSITVPLRGAAQPKMYSDSNKSTGAMRKGQQRAAGGSSGSKLEAINGTVTASILILGAAVVVGAVGVGAVIYIFQLEPSKCLCQR